MPKKKKLGCPALQFVNEPFSKPKGATVYKTCSEIYPEVKRAPTDEAYFWFEPSFKTTKTDKKRSIVRSSSLFYQYLPELQFAANEQAPENSLSTLTKQKSCPLFPLKSPEVISRKAVVLVEETPEHTSHLTRNYSKCESFSISFQCHGVLCF
ncbi:hypothetical protein EWB00_003950 [Schistosoma japonicum]|uniref:Uncharacterized protein n=1 Tax=Schistosoma japonicum TaxID=6182 RepID=A0A4Z2DVS0_SCHJA|nr:hypothetical protein KSF78_0000601 [Schistosoma japonicum]TNN20539.1 hypothetical protein EWB00_003950 [Schistosoma japonicum]